MPFNSLPFLVFFTVVFYAYWLLGHRAQNRFLLLAGAVFYGYWDYRFLGLLAFSVVFNFVCGKLVHDATTEAQRRARLVGCICVNVALLVVFKYLNFFMSMAYDALEAIHISPPRYAFGIILPLGISFYTFQAMSYSIDIFQGTLEPTDDILDFALFIVFFPLLLAGPIERGSTLLPQVRTPRAFDFSRVTDGLCLMVYGFFKKAAVADNLDPLVAPVFADLARTATAEIALASVLFTFQLYFDFSGYSDIARGIGKSLGFELIANFDKPFFARNPVEFWNRWHISLSSWFRDYVYLPLSMHFMRRSLGFTSRYRAHFVVFTLLGLWHGADLKYLAFGLWWALGIVAFTSLAKRWRRLPGWMATIAHMGLLVVPSFFLFRVESLRDVVHPFRNGHLPLRHFALDAAVLEQLGRAGALSPEVRNLLLCLLLVSALMLVELTLHLRPELERRLPQLPYTSKCAYIMLVVVATMLFRAPDYAAFVYFQF